MYIIRQFDFTLIPTIEIPENRYLEIKHGIEFVCRMVEETAKKTNIEFAVFAFPNGRNADKYPSVCFSEGCVYFGIYNKKDSIIEDECFANFFEGFDSSSFEGFAKRCHNLLHQMSRGYGINIGTLPFVWQTYLKQREKYQI